MRITFLTLGLYFRVTILARVLDDFFCMDMTVQMMVKRL